jgi:hypothetical protein
MKFTIELEDFYLEEGEITEALKDHIKTSVVYQISQNIKEQVAGFMDHHLKSQITDQLKTRVQLLMDDLLATGKVKDRYSNKEITAKEWIASEFTQKGTDITEFIKKQVVFHVKELQNRYDLLFASQLIIKMKDQGFLKEDVAKLLLQQEQAG